MQYGYDLLKAGSLIETRRKQYGWTLQETSDYVGTSESHLYQVEHGLRGLSVKLLVRIATVLELDVNELLGVSQIEKSEVSIDQLLSSFSNQDKEFFRELFLSLLQKHLMTVEGGA